MLIVLMVMAGCRKPLPTFRTEVLNGFTPVKSQGTSQLCWAYAMLAAIETEHIMRGDSVNLSVAYVEKMLEQEPSAPANRRGMGQTLLNLIGKHGLVPYESMRTTDIPAPRWAFMYGMRYTPQEFARSVCAPGEYIGLGTTRQQPYFAYYEPSTPDNWEHNRLLNMPADSLLRMVERAVSEGHGICWEGDISEMGFDWENGVARLTLINGTTTDDHCMSIVGLASDTDGERYFIMKNSWGRNNAFNGLLYMHAAYFLKKTVAVYLPRSVLHSN